MSGVEGSGRRWRVVQKSQSAQPKVRCNLLGQSEGVSSAKPHLTDRLVSPGPALRLFYS